MHDSTFDEFTARLLRDDITLVNPTREYLVNNRLKYHAGLIVKVWERQKDVVAYSALMRIHPKSSCFGTPIKIGKTNGTWGIYLPGNIG